MRDETEDERDIIYMEECLKFQEFIRQKSCLAKEARDFTHDSTILAKIADNRLLFTAYIRLDGDRTTNLGEALGKLINNKILIHFAEIDCYGIYTQEQYEHFCSNHICITGADKKSSSFPITMYQIILINSTQRFVFICTNEIYYDQIIEYATECFGSAPIQTKNQFIVNVSCNNENEVQDAFRKLYGYICCKGDKQSCDSIQMIHPAISSQYFYKSFNCTDNLIKLNKQNQKKPRIDLFPPGITAETMINSTDNKTINKNHSSNSKENIAMNYIRSNPPKPKQKSSDYHAEYFKATNGRLNMKDFGNLIKECGYERNRANWGVHWTKR